MGAGSSPPAVRQPVRALAAWLDGTARSRLDRDGLGGAFPDAGALAGRGAPDQSGLIGAVPPELAGHLAALRASDGARRMFEGGWQVAMVTDLRRVIAAQPTVTVAAVDGASGSDGAARDPLAVVSKIVCLLLARFPGLLSFQL